MKKVSRKTVLWIERKQALHECRRANEHIPIHMHVHIHDCTQHLGVLHVMYLPVYNHVYVHYMLCTCICTPKIPNLMYMNMSKSEFQGCDLIRWHGA